MSIVKTDLPMTAERCEETIRALAEEYPMFRVGLLTVTSAGRPVLTLTIGTGKRRVLYTAAHHANEWITTPVILKFLEELAHAAQTGQLLGDVDAGRLLSEVTIYTVPMVNPDGVALVTGGATPEEVDSARKLADNYPEIPFPDGWKADGAGVDLNLQYPAGWLRAREIKFSQGYTRPGPRDYVGRFPLSRRETAALATWTEAVDPALVLAWHTQGKEIYWQFDDIFVSGARELGEEMARKSGYTLADTPYDSGFAGYKDWFIQTFRRPGYTIEAGSGENPLPLTQFGEIYRDALPILLTAAEDLEEKG